MGNIMSSVLQEWVHSAPWKCQSILLSGLRGTDNRQQPATKAVSRWIRKLAQNNADPSKGYMQDDPLPSHKELCAELEYLSCHYTHHLADALRVVALWHPVRDIRHRAFVYHYTIAEELFHFVPESDEQFRERHQDKVAHS
jgi:hypothetical protein